MTATAPELSKSDFFDFVTSNEVTDAQYKQQMRSVSVFMESPDSRSNPLLSEEPKEQNNNSLLSVPRSPSDTMAPAATTTLDSFNSIWNVNRDKDRIDSGMLDLNKYFWSQDNDLHSSIPSTDTAISNKLISNNTDGQIYTLTVLNQDLNESSTSRYWGKEEDVSMSSPNDIEQNSSLDLESILNINGFPSDFNQGTLNSNIIPKVEALDYDEVDADNSQSNEYTSSSLVNYDDAEFSSSDRNDEPRATIIATTISESPAEFNNNNNDWKLTNQNSESQESLLRSALQGKAVIRYSAVQKSSVTKLDGSTEIKHVIINNNNKTDMPSMYSDNKDTDNTELLMSISPHNGNVNISILLDESNTAVISNGDPTSAQSVDDILLSQLDSNYPDDYEKLKRIASELGESIQPYCTVQPIDPTRSVYNIHHVNGELVTMIPAGEVQLPQHLQIVTASPTVTSTKSSKKHKRVQNKNSPATVQAHSSTAIQPATSTSNGVRKERSLHYCSICSKGFKDKYSVNVHVRTHTGEKPFACSLCGKSFRQKAHLAKHYQTHVAQKAAAANGTLKTTKQR